MYQREASYQVVVPRDVIEESRLPSSSGGFVSRNDLDTYVRGLISLETLLARTVSGSAAAESDAR